MPIGTVDYVSTAAWNDPFNPWPAYAQVSLSAADIPPVILTLTYFDPPGTVDYLNDAVAEQPALIRLPSPSGWLIMYNGDDYYELDTITRAIPAGYLQGNTNWQSAGAGAFETTLSIIPITTSLNPWEFRRRRLLEIV